MRQASNEYHKARCARLRSEYVALLGGRCVRCGQTDEAELEFDHIDSKIKSFTISRSITKAKALMLLELAKCQLLCKNCHNLKTLQDCNRQPVKDTDVHGTLSSYRYCRCQVCKAAKSKYSREHTKNMVSVA